jgi:AcrR family transcriptional regulator
MLRILRKTAPSKALATRDPERTREKILRAALKEFAAHGFAGARVDAVARRAAINKRMLYHYFGDKQGLFREVLRRKIAEREHFAEVAPKNPGDNLAFRFGVACKDTDWIRLLKWETLQTAGQKLIDEPERMRVAAGAVKRVRQQQADGYLNRDLDPRHTLLAVAALTIYPLAFPQLTRLITGQAADDPRFQKAYAGFLRRFAVAFQPANPRGLRKKSPKF